MVLYVPTWEVLEDGNVGLHQIMSVPFQLIPFRLQFIYSACFRMPILLLQFLTSFIALTGRSRWLACLKSPIIPALVVLMVSASQRLLGRPKVKKDPVTPEMLKALVESNITDKSPSVSDRRSVALCLIGYAGFFPF